VDSYLVCCKFIQLVSACQKIGKLLQEDNNILLILWAFLEDKSLPWLCLSVSKITEKLVDEF